MKHSSILWYERYTGLDRYVSGDDYGLYLVQSRSFLRDNLEISVGELPLPYAFMWMVKSEDSIARYMDEEFSLVFAPDLVAFIVFTEALLAKIGRMDMSRSRYIALFTVFQYLLGQRMALETGAAAGGAFMNVGLFDFDRYDALYFSLQGAKLAD